MVATHVLFPSPGVSCEVNIDDCASNPCTFGICRDGINRYDCVCQPGFTGGQVAAMERRSLEGEGEIIHLPWLGFVPLFALACPTRLPTLCPEVVRSLVGMRLSLYWLKFILEHRCCPDWIGVFLSGAKVILRANESDFVQVWG